MESNGYQHFLENQWEPGTVVVGASASWKQGAAMELKPLDKEHNRIRNTHIYPVYEAL